MTEQVMIPDGLPSLSRGSHSPTEGAGCVMELISVLAGENWSDQPACTHPILGAAAIMTNDNLTDEDRPLLVPLIGRLIGTTDRSTPVTMALRTHLADQQQTTDVNDTPDSIVRDSWHSVFSTYIEQNRLACTCGECDAEKHAAAKPMVAWLARLIDVYDEASGRQVGARRVITHDEAVYVREVVTART